MAENKISQSEKFSMKLIIFEAIKLIGSFIQMNSYIIQKKTNETNIPYLKTQSLIFQLFINDALIIFYA